MDVMVERIWRVRLLLDCKLFQSVQIDIVASFEWIVSEPNICEPIHKGSQILGSESHIDLANSKENEFWSFKTVNLKWVKIPNFSITESRSNISETFVT